jgi:hypothetical protein
VFDVGTDIWAYGGGGSGDGGGCIVRSFIIGEVFNDLHCSPTIVRVIKLRCSTDGGGERCVQGFSGDTCGKETTGKTQA